MTSQPRPLRPLFGTAAAVGGFFALKIGVGLLLVTASAHRLPVAGFVTFSQLFLFFALLSSVSAGGVQQGLIRQIAIADGALEAERRAVAASLAIWAACTIFFLVTALAAGRPLAIMLVGTPALAPLLLPLTALAAVGGAGVLLCGILSGRGRAPTAFAIQGVGLLVGGLACYQRLLAGDATGAVLAYAAGPALTALAALVATRSAIALHRWAAIRSEVQLLLRYSGSYLALIVIMPTTLFALRYLYRLEAGTEALGYWLAANRVSDVTSQLIGLYMGQIFLPQVTRIADAAATRRLFVTTAIAGSLVMACGWAIFVLGAPMLVETFLSARFLPAIPFISFYLLGDALRVAASAGLHLMLARGRLALFVGIELATASLLAILTVALLAAGRSEAPYLAYPVTYGAVSLIAMVLAFRRPALIAGTPPRDQGSLSG